MFKYIDISIYMCVYIFKYIYIGKYIFEARIRLTFKFKVHFHRTTNRNLSNKNLMNTNHCRLKQIFCFITAISFRISTNGSLDAEQMKKPSTLHLVASSETTPSVCRTADGHSPCPISQLRHASLMALA